jgi:hypothetical protein
MVMNWMVSYGVGSIFMSWPTIVFSWGVLLNGMAFRANTEKEYKNVISVKLLMPNSIGWHSASSRDDNDPWPHQTVTSMNNSIFTCKNVSQFVLRYDPQEYNLLWIWSTECAQSQVGVLRIYCMVTKTGWNMQYFENCCLTQEVCVLEPF